MEVASQRHTKERQKYVQLGDSCQRLKEKAEGKVNDPEEREEGVNK